MSKLFMKSKRPQKLDSVSSLKLEEQKPWSSETDLHKLPPLSTAMPISPRLAREGMHRQRPPTPSPNRSPAVNILNGYPRLAPLSPASSTQRLSLNLDLITLKEEIVAFEGDRVSMPESPRLRVRSLPSSPRTSPRNRILKRVSSDSENGPKDERIVEWIRNVQKSEDTDENSDAFEQLSSTSDLSDHDLCGSPVLPAIHEHTMLNSLSSLSWRPLHGKYTVEVTLDTISVLMKWLNYSVGSIIVLLRKSKFTIACVDCVSVSKETIIDRVKMYDN